MYNFEKLYKELNIIDKPVFKFYHYLHTHQPIRFNENGEYNANTIQNRDNANLEIKYALKEFNKLLTKLKENNIYDNSLIVFTSDHGYGADIQPKEINGKKYLGGTINSKSFWWPASRYWPTLLVKLPNQRDSLKINNNPVELIDIMPTIFKNKNIKNENKLDGIDLFSNVTQERYSMFYVGGAKNLKNSHVDSSFFTKNKIDKNSFLSVPNAMNNISMTYYELKSNAIYFFNNLDIDNNGLSGIENWGRWSDSKTAKLYFKLDEDSCKSKSLVMKLDAFVSSKNPEQKAKVFLNNQAIGELVIKDGEVRPRDFNFDIQNKTNCTEVNELKFEIENPVSPKSVGVNSDVRELGFGFISMEFK